MTKTDQTYYKILRNGCSCNGGSMEWGLPKGKRPGKWRHVKGELSPCNRGIHLATQPHQTWFRHLDCQVFEVEPGKRIIPHGDGKIVTEKARLIREVPPPEWLTRARKLVAEIPSTPWFKADGNPLPEWKLFPTGDVAGEAAWDAAGDAAWDAAWDARGEIIADILDPVHLAHLRARWQVWQKGYGLLCDVNGTLYVYEKP